MITLSYQEWFKIYLVLDNLDNIKYKKSFLLMSEFWKNQIYDIFKVCVALLDVPNLGESSELYHYKKLVEGGCDVDGYDDFLNECKALDDEYISLLSSEMSFDGYKIHESILPTLDDEILEVLKPILGGLDG